MLARHTFTVLLGGQIASWLGSGMAGFAVGVWAFQRTGSATQFALITFFGTLPGLIVSPLAGVVVDRWDRRWLMILGDAAAALTSVALLLLLWPVDRLEIWHLYVVTATNSFFGAVQQPAFQASIPLLGPKERLGRVAGFVQMGSALPQLLAPLMAGALFALIGLAGVLVLDLATAILAICSLLLVRIPSVRRNEAEPGKRNEGLWAAAVEGWRFLQLRKGLLALLGLFAAVNFANSMVQVLLAPMILSFSSPQGLGLVLFATSASFLVGGAIMAATGGPQRRARAIVGVILVQGVCLIGAGWMPEIAVVAAALGGFMVLMAIAAGSSQVIWQSKVPPHLMGRVFSTRRLIAMSTVPVAYLLAGPLADGVFEPWMRPGGRFAETVGSVLGVGPGRGIGLMFVILGAVVIACGLVGARSHRLIRLEDELEDGFDGEAPLS